MTEDKISKEEVKHIADLAKLPLTEEELEKLSLELSDTISHINNLSQLNEQITDLSETSQVSGQKNVFREDEVDAGRVLTQKDALSSGKNTYEGYFVVKKIFG